MSCWFLASRSGKSRDEAGRRNGRYGAERQIEILCKQRDAPAPTSNPEVIGFLPRLSCVSTRSVKQPSEVYLAKRYRAITDGPTLPGLAKPTAWPSRLARRHLTIASTSWRKSALKYHIIPREDLQRDYNEIGAVDRLNSYFWFGRLELKRKRLFRERCKIN